MDVLINTTQNFTHTFNSAAFNDTTYKLNYTLHHNMIALMIPRFTITVYPDPIATIVDTGSLIGCEGLTIDENMIYAQEFINNNDTYLWTYTDANGNIITSLDYPSGIENISNIIPPTYSMTQDGDTVIVILTTLNNHGCVQGTDSVQVITIENPTADFSLTDSTGCHPLEIDITYTGSSVVYWEWDFDNTNISSGTIGGSTNQGPHTVTYENVWEQDTTYTIQLIVGDPDGCLDTTYREVLVHPLPEPYFSATEECFGNTTEFNDSSIATVTQIDSWFWDFGDNINNDSIENPSLEYSSPGVYNVCLTVTDLNECEESYCDTVIVRPNPVAEIEVLYDCFPEPGCSNEISSFNSLSILDSLGGNLDSALWYINLNLESSLIESDTFDNIFSSGQYNVGLTVISNYNCIDTDSVIIEIVDIPISNFSLSNDTICVGDSISITENNSSGYILNYQRAVYGSENDTLFEYNSSDSIQPLLPFLPQGLNDTTYIISLNDKQLLW